MDLEHIWRFEYSELDQNVVTCEHCNLTVAMSINDEDESTPLIDGIIVPNPDVPIMPLHLMIFTRDASYTVFDIPIGLELEDLPCDFHEICKLSIIQQVLSE